MNDPQNRLDSMLTKLREHKFRVTPQRIAVLKILALSDGHPSVEQIFEQVKKDFPTTSLATVYKTVTLLKQLNEVLELGFTEGSNRYDGNRPYSHPHLICIKCKKIVDPDLDNPGRIAMACAHPMRSARGQFSSTCVYFNIIKGSLSCFCKNRIFIFN